MKRIWLLFILAASPLLAGTAVQETAREFSAAGEFNGDAYPDVLVLDKTSGIYRIGYGSASGALNFAEGRASGLSTVTGCAVGKLSGTARDSFAATNPTANRAHVLSPLTTGYTEPKNALTGVGGQLLAAFDMPAGPGRRRKTTSPAIATLDPVAGRQIRALRSNAGTWTLLTETSVPDAEVTHGNPLTPATGATPLFAYVSRGGTTDGFQAWQLTGAAATEVLALAAMPAGREWVAAVFESPRTDVIFYTPGQPTVAVRRIMTGAPWTFGAEAAVTFSEPIEQLVVVNDPAGAKVLARFTSGALALFGYTQAGGFSAPEMVEPTGAAGVLSGLVPMPGNAFQLLFAPAAGQASASAVTFTKTTAGWTQTAVSAMSAHRPLDRERQCDAARQRAFSRALRGAHPQLSRGRLGDLGLRRWRAFQRERAECQLRRRHAGNRRLGCTDARRHERRARRHCGESAARAILAFLVQLHARAGDRRRGHRPRARHVCERGEDHVHRRGRGQHDFHPSQRQRGFHRMVGGDRPVDFLADDGGISRPQFRRHHLADALGAL